MQAAINPEPDLALRRLILDEKAQVIELHRLSIYTKEELVVNDDGTPKKLPWEDWREGDDLMTSGWMRATALLVGPHMPDASAAEPSSRSSVLQPRVPTVAPFSRKELPGSIVCLPASTVGALEAPQ